MYFGYCLNHRRLKCYFFLFSFAFAARIPRRGILGALMFLACMFSYFIRTNFSISIVAMVNAPSKSKEGGSYCGDHLSSSNLTINKTLSDVSCRRFQKPVVVFFCFFLFSHTLSNITMLNFSMANASPGINTFKDNCYRRISTVFCPAAFPLVC